MAVQPTNSADSDGPFARASAAGGTGQPSALTLRSISLGLLLVVLIAAATPYNDYVRHNTFLIGNFLPITVVSCMFLLCVLLNPLLGRFRLRSAEMAVAIGMMLVACAVPSSGLLRFFEPDLIGVVHQSAGNPWSRAAVRAVPGALLPAKNPQSPTIMNGFLGVPPGRSVWPTFAAWAAPAFWWGCFFCAMFAAILLFCVIMRRQWVVHERLPFPLAEIPLEMLAEPADGQRLNALWRSGGLWVAAGIVFLIHLCNGLHQFMPGLPVFPLRYDFSAALSQRPWTAVSHALTSAHVYFVMIGAIYFVPQDVAFSCWFFFVAYQLVKVGQTAAGAPAAPNAAGWQALGAFMAYGGLVFWVARRHLAAVVRAAWKGQPRLADEYLSYRTAVVGLLLALAAATLFFVHFGVPWWFALAVVLAFLYACMVLTRVVAETGLLVVLLPYGAGPMHLLGGLFGGLPSLGLKNVLSGWFGPHGGRAAAPPHASAHAPKLPPAPRPPPAATPNPQRLRTMRSWMLASLSNRFIMADQRENLMPFAADTLRMTAIAPTRQRAATLGWLAAAILLSLVVSGFVHHLVDYRWGTGSFDPWTSQWSSANIVSTARAQAQPAPAGINAAHGGNAFVGALAMVAVGLLRLNWVACPLHPIGLLLFNSAAVFTMWFSIFLGYIAKAVILRYGGAGLYQRAKPVFIGLIVGESLAGLLWIVVGLFIHWPHGAYHVLPG